MRREETSMESRDGLRHTKPNIPNFLITQFCTQKDSRMQLPPTFDSIVCPPSLFGNGGTSVCGMS
ncbi:hypothetical protein JB92DRAFT_3068211 [Gautieria morchelliformis]|nr:hypothetical protein JB92DRAFT_3068211 [Gautieria morchelliformis]